jgi:hypothetical protein
MKQNYSSEQIAKLIEEFGKQFPTECIDTLQYSFWWRKQNFPAACETRKMGFSRPIGQQINDCPQFWSDLNVALNSFKNASTENLADCVKPLVKLLGHKGIGMARASKWICFVDQNRYAIFDSRVSIAMRKLKLDGCRAFPILPRKLKNGMQAWKPDYQVVTSSIRLARAYIDFLRVIAGASTVSNRTPSQIEMALFMAGDVWRFESESLSSLPEKIWLANERPEAEAIQADPQPPSKCRLKNHHSLRATDWQSTV